MIKIKHDASKTEAAVEQICANAQRQRQANDLRGPVGPKRVTMAEKITKFLSNPAGACKGCLCPSPPQAPVAPRILFHAPPMAPPAYHAVGLVAPPMAALSSRSNAVRL